MLSVPRKRTIDLRCLVLAITALGISMLATTNVTDATKSTDEEPCTPRWDYSFAANAMNAWVYTLTTATIDGEQAVYAGGYFTEAGGQSASSVARWNGREWERVGDGLTGMIMAITSFDDGSGETIYIGGVFSGASEDLADGRGAARGRGAQRGQGRDAQQRGRGREAQPQRGRGRDAPQRGRAAPDNDANGLRNLAKLDRETGQWVCVGGGTDQAVIALTTFDDGSGNALYVGGTFSSVGDNQRLAGLARWNGEEWQSVGEGRFDGGVRAFASRNTDDGRELYVGGIFKQIGDERFNGIARWDGTSWTGLENGTIGHGPRTLAIVNEADGPALYVGGVFTHIGNQRVNNTARWDLSTQEWSPLGTGVNERVVNMTGFDDGSGEKLYIAGWFTQADGQAINRIATWDGSTWRQVGERGPNMVVRGMTAMRDERGYDVLYIGGGFTRLEDKPAGHMARWIGCRRVQDRPTTSPRPNETGASDDAGREEAR